MGQFIEYIKMAFENIRSNKGRSFLTMLGIIIGISSVITIVSLGSGMKQMVESENEKSTQPITIEVNTENTTNMSLLTMEDLRALEEELPSRIQYAYVMAGGPLSTTETRKGKFDVSVVFTVPAYNQLYEGTENKIYRGRYFDEDDLTNGFRNAVIDKAGALSLFGTTDIVGMDLELTMNNRVQNVKIVGVRDATQESIASMKESYEMFGWEPSIQLEMPYTVASAFGDEITGFSSVTVKPQPDQSQASVANAAMNLLQKRHLSDGENLFKKNDLSALINSMGVIIDSITTFIAFVAGISLLVGGIGVMNIMLVSVTERTREIGIRKSLGATTSSILMQFLCESAIITGIGGILGIILGIGVAELISSLKIAGLTARISIPAIVIATLFSCGVGIVFGIYPAKKAANLSPIEALRRI